MHGRGQPAMLAGLAVPADPGRRSTCRTGSALQVLESKKQFPGVTADVQPAVHYQQPVATDMAQILGYLQPITAQEVQAAARAGDRLLRRGPGRPVRAGGAVRQGAARDARASTRSPSTRPARSRARSRTTKPVAGDDLVTSINANVQEATQNALRDAILKTQAEGNTGRHLRRRGRDDHDRPGRRDGQLPDATTRASGPAASPRSSSRRCSAPATASRSWSAPPRASTRRARPGR